MKTIAIPFAGRVWVMSIACTIILASCASKNEKESEEKFAVVTPLVMDTSFQNEYIAEINALQNVEIRARIKGFIESVRVDEGQTVKKGQTLFSISATEYEQELLKAKAATKGAIADLKLAEIEFDNSRKLFDKNVIAKTELDLMQAKADAAKAKVDEARADEAQAAINLAFAEIKAPFDGIINRIPNKVGSLVDEGALLTTISNNNEMYAYFNMSEKEYLDYVTSSKYEKSNDVTLILANNAQYPLTGKVETSESEFEKSTGNIAFRARFFNPDNILRHGGTGKILVKTDLKHAMMIPQKSTFEIQQNLYVFVVNKNDIIEQRKVIPSVKLSHMYVITSGLSPDETIIYDGIQRVKAGDRILPEKRILTSITNI